MPSPRPWTSVAAERWTYDLGWTGLEAGVPMMILCGLVIGPFIALAFYFCKDSSNPNVFEPAPPSILSQLSSAPLQYFTRYLYNKHLTTYEPPKPQVPPIRVVCISDTHNRRPNVPDGDILIHAGDFTENGSLAELKGQMDWLKSLPHKRKFVIAGNHDSYLDPQARKHLKVEDRASSLSFKRYNVTDLNSQPFSVSIGKTDPSTGKTVTRKLKIYGRPHVPQCGGKSFAFQYHRHAHGWENKVPKDTDILITHTPPRYHRDVSSRGISHSGCQGLLDEVWRVRPRLHVFGHIHASRGKSVVRWDLGKRAYERACSRRASLRELVDWSAWKDLITVSICAYYRNQNREWEVGEVEKGYSIMVNAAIGEQDSIDESVHVVDL